jgi:hypothetical protein
MMTIKTMTIKMMAVISMMMKSTTKMIQGVTQTLVQVMREVDMKCTMRTMKEIMNTVGARVMPTKMVALMMTSLLRPLHTSDVVPSAVALHSVGNYFYGFYPYSAQRS